MWYLGTFHGSFTTYVGEAFWDQLYLEWTGHLGAFFHMAAVILTAMGTIWCVKKMIRLANRS